MHFPLLAARSYGYIRAMNGRTWFLNLFFSFLRGEARVGGLLKGCQGELVYMYKRGGAVSKYPSAG